MFELLHLCDSLFPIGGFSHSDGLEAATEGGQVSCAADLEWWMDACLEETLGRTEGPAVWRAWHLVAGGRLSEVPALDSEVHALRASSTARDASRSMGTRLLATWHRLHPHPALSTLLTPATHPAFTLPVSFGAVCAVSEIGARQAVEGFFYTRLAATVSSAMRLMPIGQHEAHQRLARTLDRAPRVVDAVVSGDRRPASFAPALDLAMMSQQYVHSRLFRS